MLTVSTGALATSRSWAAASNGNCSRNRNSIDRSLFISSSLARRRRLRPPLSEGWLTPSLRVYITDDFPLICGILHARFVHIVREDRRPPPPCRCRGRNRAVTSPLRTIPRGRHAGHAASIHIRGRLGGSRAD